MAPGTPIAGDATADGEGSRGNLHRWPETTKVYTRKIHNKIPKIPKINPQPQPQPQPQPEPKPPPPPEPPASASDVVTPSEPPPPAEVRPASPDDASSHQEDSRMVKISLRSRSRDEICVLRKRLADELDQVRAFLRKIESDYGGGEGEYAQSQDSAAPAANGTDEGFEKEEDRMASYRQLSVSIPEVNGDDNNLIEVFEKEERTPNYHQLNGNVYARFKGFEEERTPKYHQLSANYGMPERFVKEKRTPKANQLYQNSDFILIGKDKFPPVESNKKLKHNGNGHSNSFLEKKYAHAFKSCAALLARLMKHKFGWVFNSPVDVKGLGLHDYYTIIKHPMDLGTVKLRLNKNWYKSPGEFTEDVRLTFRNAMTYNPKGQDVHIMAQQLSQIFEDRWPSIEAEYAYVPYPPTPVAKKLPPIDVRMLERSDSTVYPMAIETKKPVNYPPLAPTPTTIGRPPVLRQPKPKAKDLYKREMTMEEKQKLSGHLQNLPPEKLDGVVQIIRKRNSALCLQEDEIEIDIDCVDTETLWELDRFMTNYKKSLSKYKRKAELAILAKAKAERERGQDRVLEMGVMGESRENNTVMTQKEDNSSFPAGGENKREIPTRSSSSSSSSSDSGSSSSDSDSDSSSESDAAH